MGWVLTINTDHTTSQLPSYMTPRPPARTTVCNYMLLCVIIGSMSASLTRCKPYEVG